MSPERACVFQKAIEAGALFNESAPQGKHITQAVSCQSEYIDV